MWLYLQAGWVYDRTTFGSSAVMDWDLVCEKKGTIFSMKMEEKPFKSSLKIRGCFIRRRKRNFHPRCCLYDFLVIFSFSANRKEIRKLPEHKKTMGRKLNLRISPQIFEKIWNGPNGILRGLGETDSWKKPEVENLVTFKLFQEPRGTSPVVDKYRQWQLVCHEYEYQKNY